MLASQWTKAWIMTWLGLQYCLLLNWCLKRTDRNSDIVGNRKNQIYMKFARKKRLLFDKWCQASKSKISHS